jgi:hypothetical protein
MGRHGIRLRSKAKAKAMTRETKKAPNGLHKYFRPRRRNSFSEPGAKRRNGLASDQSIERTNGDRVSANLVNSVPTSDLIIVRRPTPRHLGKKRSGAIDKC